MEADLLAPGPDESDMDLTDHQISEALEVINEVDFTKNASYATIILKKASDANIGKMEKEMLEKFANQGFDEKMEEDVIMDDESYNCIVCQTSEQNVTVTPVGKGPKDWPDFILVDQEWASKDERSRRPLRMGDLVEVISCTPLEFRLNNLSETEMIAKRLKESGRFLCMAKATRVKSIFQLSKREVPGIALDFQMCKKTGKLRYISVIGAGVTCSQKIFKWQMSDDLTMRIKKDPVTLDMVEITRPSDLKIAKGGGYILPANSIHGTIEDRKVHQPQLIISISKLNTKFTYPFNSKMSTEEIKVSEKLLGAAVAAVIDKTLTDLEEAQVEVVPMIEEVKGNIIIMNFEYLINTKNRLVRFAEVWQEDCPISVKLNYPEAKPCASGYVLENERSVYYEGFMFKAKLLLAFQPARKYDAESDFEMIKEGAEIKISPTASINALEMRMESFSYNLLSEIASMDTPKGKVTKILLGLAEKSEYPKLNMKKLRQSHPVLARLQTSQGDTAMLMLDERPRGVFQQAPPGTGKTYTAMSIVAATMKMFPEAHILCMAPLNIAVVKMCLELEEAMKIEGIHEPVLALFSGNGKTRYKEQIESISTHLLAHAVDSPEFTSKLELTDLKKVDRYKKACISHPRLASEGAIAQLLLEQVKRRVIFLTLGLTEQLCKLFPETEILILDEAGQAPFSQFLSVTTFFPKLRKVLVTGDKFQLKVHLISLPEAVRENYGLDTCIESFDSSEGIDKTTLIVNFRSHPQIVKCVEAGAYIPANQMLLPREGGDFSMLLNMKNFFVPVAGSPLILLNQTSPMLAQDTNFSSTNSGQTRTTIQILEALSAIGFKGSIRVICLYAAQATEIGREVADRELPGIQTLSADAMQGHETDLAIVVTTATQRGENTTVDNSREFWADPARVNVALSRGKHALILIGDLRYLMKQEGIWSRFLRKALEFTIVADSTHYCRAMINSEAEYVNGLLHLKGASVRDERFYTGQTNQISQPQTGPTRYTEWQSSSQREWRPKECQRCGQRGHVARECRK
ncbi:unnamed protein product [Meloidogyne enterolobii]